MKTLLKYAPSGRPLLHAADDAGRVVPVLGVIATAINALIANETLPQRELAIDVLRQAQIQAAQPLLQGALPHDRILSLVLSTMTGEPEVHARAGVVHEVLGFAQYDALDIGWVGSLVSYLTSRKVDFPVGPQPPIEIPDTVTFAVAGDWGTGIEPALTIGKLMASHLADYTIHLGDTYYAGLPSEEQNNFVQWWPQGMRGSFALNSNHEMYAGGVGYFEKALTSSTFALQDGLSYFALRNSHWLMIGLDTAYFADNMLYQDGDLGDPANAQNAWFREMLAARGDRNVIILTHHDGFDVDPYAGTATFKKLYSTMVAEMTGVPRWYWYWGHAHAGVVYQPIVNGTSVVYPRCIGHGGIPWEPFPPLVPPLNDPRVGVVWAETQVVPNTSRAANGYMTITLADEKIVETLYDETGRLRHGG